MSRWICTLAGTLLACAFPMGVRAAPPSPYEELAAKLPADTNCVMAADIQALFRSQFGAEHKWQAKVANDFRSGLMNTPPSALRVIVGESFDYASLQPRWRVKINQLSKDVTAERVAQKFGGTVDTVANLPVVVCPRDQLFVNYAPTLVGEINGIQRQDLSRLLRTTGRGHSTTISPYLKSLLGTVGNSAQIVMAFDLEDVFHSSGLKEKLKDAKALKDTRTDLAELTKTLEGLRGAQLRFKVTTDIEGELRLDLSTSAEPLRAVGKALVLEVLDHIGANLDDLDKWSSSVDGNTFVLKGKLALASARLLLSPVDNRASRQAYLESDGGTTSTARLDAKAMATIEYYRSMSSLMEDIAPGQKTKANSTEKRTFYYKQYAEKIDSLAILNVDPGLVQFGQALALTLRNLSRLSTMTQSAYTNALAQYRTDFAMNTVSGSYGGYAGSASYGGGWSYSAYTPSAVNVDNFMDVRNMMASTAQNSQALREKTWVNIKQSMQTVRQQLVTKYKTEV